MCRRSRFVFQNIWLTNIVTQIITTEEAERRGHIYDKEGATYLFDLDYVDDEYTVDAAHYGNISHFVNHSVSSVCTVKQYNNVLYKQTNLHNLSVQCDPNLQVYNVFIENLDERLPRIAFFATRPISAGEELTFDYKMKSMFFVCASCLCKGMQWPHIWNNPAIMVEKNIF